MTLTLAVALLALLVALAGLAAGLLAWRKADDAQHSAHTHPKPPRERREVNLGAPRAVGERRGAHRPPEPDPSTVEQPATAEHAPPTATIDLTQPPPSQPVRLPPPGAIGRR